MHAPQPDTYVIVGKTKTKVDPKKAQSETPPPGSYIHQYGKLN